MPAAYCPLDAPPRSRSPMFDFDRVIERRGTHASKWDNMARLSGIDAPDAIPMWVADMDFAAPPGVTEALAAEIERATHGYYADTGSWAAALADWMARRHGLRVDPAWVSPTPGDRLRARPHPAGGQRARRRGRRLPARLSRLPPDHPRQRAAHSRCAAGRDRRPLRHGPRRAARQADAADQGRLLLQPAQSRRHRVVGRRDPRAGRASAPSTT